MDQNTIPIFGILFGVGLPLSIPIVWIVLNYRKRRRLMELHHAERMAAIERGMDLPPLPMELVDGNSPRRRRSALLPGLVWFCVGVALVIGVGTTRDEDFPVFFGLIPLAVGVAYLIYYFAEGRKLEARLLEHDFPAKAGGASAERINAPSDELRQAR